MVSDNHNNESFNLIKYIVFILISISIVLLIATLHHREVIFASQTGYSFGVIDVEGELVQSEPYNGDIVDAFLYNFTNAVNNFRVLNNHSQFSLSDVKSYLESSLDSHGTPILETFFELGYFPNVCLLNSGSQYYLVIVWQKLDNVVALTFPNNIPTIKSSKYPSLIDTRVIFDDTLWSSFGTYNGRTNYYFTLYLNINSSSNNIYVLDLGEVNRSSLNDYPIRYGVGSSTYPVMTYHYLDNSLTLPIKPYLVILCSYPFYNFFAGSDIFYSTITKDSNGTTTLSIPTYSDTNMYSIGVNPLTTYWFSQTEFSPLYPTPTPVPTALPTITPTPLPLAFDSTIDGMEDGTTLGFLESLSDGFDALISTFTVIPFFSVSISYLYNYSPWFRLLFFVPIVAFLSFLIGRNKS